MSNDANIPVLIVGAGPTGLMLAITLRCHGVAVRLIDRLPAPATISKALAVWSGSMEALAGIGVIDRFLAAGVRLRSLHARSCRPGAIRRGCLRFASTNGSRRGIASVASFSPAMPRTSTAPPVGRA